MLSELGEFELELEPKRRQTLLCDVGVPHGGCQGFGSGQVPFGIAVKGGHPYWPAKGFLT